MYSSFGTRWYSEQSIREKISRVKAYVEAVEKVPETL